ncbi:MAG: tandem-95 repeat protein, partial [Gammaproteobacteria bacterium]|nr:tandem-95 repeat protein [Gammaproteobacteria bacterium]
GQADSKFGLSVSVDDSESFIIAGAMRADAGSDRNQKTAGAAYLIELETQNKAPVAVSDSATTDQDTAVTTGDVLANDTDADGDTLSIKSADSMSIEGGTVVDNGNGTFTYTPKVGFSGSDSFNYTVSDDNGGEAQGTVDIVVNSVANKIPAAVNDSASTDEDTAVTTGNVLANDTDADGDALSVSSADSTSVEGGTVVNNGDGTFTYTPKTGFSGSDSFSYTVSDGKGGEATGTVTITVSNANKAPVTVNDSASTDEDTAVTTGNVLANDTDADGDTLSVSGADSTSVEGGTVVNNGDGTFTYTPKAGFSGSDSFSYTVSDGKGGSSAGKVDVTVKKSAPVVVNKPPVAENDSVTTPQDTVVTIDVLENDSDLDGDNLSIQSFTQGSKGKVTQSGGSLVYTPNAKFTGKDTFTYNVKDGKGGSSTAEVNVTVTVEEPSVCTTEYAPVCGLKEVQCVTTPCDSIPTTYSNMCMLDKDDSATFLYEGECKAGSNTQITIDGEVSDWKDISPVATSSNKQNLRSLKVISDADTLYFLLEGSDIGANTQFHINADNNTETGYQNGNWEGTGVDYLIEGYWLYKSTANDGSWSWGSGDVSAVEYVKSASVVEMSVKKSAIFGDGAEMIAPGRTIKVAAWDMTSDWAIISGIPEWGEAMATFSLDSAQIPLSMKLNGANPMTVVTGSTFTDPGATVTIDGDSIETVKSKDSVDTNKTGKYTLTYQATDKLGNTVTKKRAVYVVLSEGASITVDGQVSDWENIPPAATSSNKQNLRSLKIASDADTLYFLLEGSDIGANTQFHINVDNNAATGYQDGNWYDTGVDYLIENNWLYKSTTNDDSWSWGSGDGSMVVYERSSSVIEVSVKKSALSGFQGPIKVGAWDLTDGWYIISGLPNWGKEMVTFE